MGMGDVIQSEKASARDVSCGFTSIFIFREVYKLVSTFILGASLLGRFACLFGLNLFIFLIRSMLRFFADQKKNSQKTEANHHKLIFKEPPFTDLKSNHCLRGKSFGESFLHQCRCFLL
jgi:hypothetical protein